MAWYFVEKEASNAQTGKSKMISVRIIGQQYAIVIYLERKKKLSGFTRD